MYAQMATLEDFENLSYKLKFKKRGVGDDNWIPNNPRLGCTNRFNYRQHEHKDWFYRQAELDCETNPVQVAETKYNRPWLSYVSAV